MLLALFGGYGEFDAAMDDLHRLLLGHATGEGSVVILEFGHTPGLVEPDLACYKRLKAPTTVHDLPTSTEAQSAAIANDIDNAACVFLHGGNPATLAGILRGSRVWSAITAGMLSGMSLAATSGGVMCLGTHAADLHALNPALNQEPWTPGLNLLPAVFGAHWNADRYTSMNDAYLARLPAGEDLTAISEQTALAWLDHGWNIVGNGTVVAYHAGEITEYDATSTTIRLDPLHMSPALTDEGPSR